MMALGSTIMDSRLVPIFSAKLRVARRGLMKTTYRFTAQPGLLTGKLGDKDL